MDWAFQYVFSHIEYNYSALQYVFSHIETAPTVVFIF